MKSLDPSDGRQVLLQTSTFGEQVLQGERERRDHWLEEQFETLSVSDRQVLQDAAVLMRTLAAADS